MIFADCDQMADEQDKDSNDEDYNDSKDDFNEDNSDDKEVDNIPNSGFNNVDQIAGVNEDDDNKDEVGGNAMDEEGPPNDEGPPLLPNYQALDAPHEEEIAGVDDHQIGEMEENEDDGVTQDHDGGIAEDNDVGQSMVRQDEPGVMDQVEADMEARYGRGSGRYNLRARKPRDYSHLFTTKLDEYQYPIQ